MIRLAKLEDKKQINNLGLLLNPNYPKLFNLKDILKQSYAKIYVCEENNIIKGFLHVTILYEDVEIINIVVKEEERRKKIGSLLLDYFLSDLTNEVKSITLEVNEFNKAAINFYQKFGFEIISRRKNYYQNADAYLMERKV